MDEHTYGSGGTGGSNSATGSPTSADVRHERDQTIPREIADAINALVFETAQRLSERSPSSSRNTIRAYSAAWKTLLRGGYQLAGELSWEHAIKVFLALDPSGNSTWRHKRQALIRACFVWDLNRSLIAKIIRKKSASASVQSRYSTLRRRRGFDPIARHKVIQYLIAQKPTGPIPSVIAVMLIRAGTITGIRPLEWPDVEIVDDLETVKDQHFIWLHFKSSSEATQSKKRRMVISTFAPEDIVLVRNLLRNAKRFAADWKEICRSAEKEVQAASRAIWPSNAERRYTLYSTRHQFCANNLNVQDDEKDVVYMMGYSSYRDLNRHPSAAVSEIEQSWPKEVPPVCSFPCVDPSDKDGIQGRQRGRRRRRWTAHDLAKWLDATN
jgi:hypothetical protein